MCLVSNFSMGINMQTYKVVYFDKAHLTYELALAIDESAAVKALLEKGILKNSLQVYEVSVYYPGYDDTYEPEIYPVEDKALPKFFEPFCSEGAGMLETLKYVKSSVNLSPKVPLVYQCEEIFDFEDNPRKVGFVLAGLFAPEMDVNEYRFEYTLTNLETLKNNFLDCPSEDKDYDNIISYVGWLADTRVNPVFIMKDKYGLKVLEGEERLKAAFAFDSSFVAVVIAHKFEKEN